MTSAYFRIKDESKTRIEALSGTARYGLVLRANLRNLPGFMRVKLFDDKLGSKPKEALAYLRGNAVSQLRVFDGSAPEMTMEYTKHALDFAVMAAAATRVFYLGAGHRGENGLEAEKHVWGEVSADLDALDAGTDLQTLPLLRANPQWIEAAHAELRQRWNAPPPYWHHWLMWYEALLVGGAPDLTQLSAVASLPDDDWRKSPKHIANRLAELTGVPLPKLKRQAGADINDTLTPIAQTRLWIKKADRSTVTLVAARATIRTVPFIARMSPKLSEGDVRVPMPILATPRAHLVALACVHTPSSALDHAMLLHLHPACFHLADRCAASLIDMVRIKTRPVFLKEALECFSYAEGGAKISFPLPDMSDEDILDQGGHGQAARLRAKEHWKAEWWHHTLADFKVVEVGQDLMALPLWHGETPLWLDRMWLKLESDWEERAPGTFDFWRRFYQAIFAGRPLNWPLVHEIAVLSDDIWYAGEGAAAAEIAKPEVRLGRVA